MKKLHYYLLSIVFLAGMVLPAIVYAEDGLEGSESTSENEEFEQQNELWRHHKSERLEELRKNRSEMKDEHKRKAEERKLETLKKNCEKRQEHLSKRFGGITKRAEDRKNRFNTIMEQVQTYINENNLDVADFETLMSDVTEKKQALIDAHAAAKAIAENFSCEDENIKEQSTEYRTAVLEELQVFKDYKTSLKTLLKAVKQAANDAGSKPEESSNEQ